MDIKDVGRQLRAARISAALTLREHARRAGVSHQLIQKIEKGQNTTVDTLEQLAVAADAQLVIRFERGHRDRAERLSLPADRFAIASRLMAVLPRLPDDVVDSLLDDIALWESEHPPEL